MTLVLVLAGTGLVLLALVDEVWTTIAAGSGAGPVTGRLSGALWRLALGVHRRRPSHRLLTLAGVLVPLSVLLTWIVLVSVGWVLVFSASDGAVRDATTGRSADLGERAYYAGYTIFTLGNGGYAPGAGLWQLATVLAAGTGLVLVTLSITYLVPVAGAVAHRRQVAGHIASLGTDPADIVVRAWSGSGFGSLGQHLVSLTELVQAARQRHLTYPVLHYFHSTDRENALGPGLAHLWGAVHLLRHGVAPGQRPDPAALRPIDDAIGAFLSTLSTAHIDRVDPPVPVPDLAPLRAAGIPVVDDATYREASGSTLERRSLLAGLLDDDGWSLDDA